MEHTRMIQGRLIQSKHGYTLRFTDEETGLVVSLSGPLIKLSKYTWSRLCQWDSISPDTQFCAFSSNNPWQALHSLTSANLIATLHKKG